MRKSISISKLDAAKRQLETAVRLYFHDGEPVSIHTLVSAAYNVIRDINTKRGGPPMLVKDGMLDYIKPEYQRDFRNKINEAENFFKHADKDHDATLDFNPDQTEVIILDATGQYHRLTGEDPVLFKVFRGWYIANHLHQFNLPPDQKKVFGTAAPAAIELGKTAYFNAVLPVMMKAGT
jgi:hypothetical protein